MKDTIDEIIGLAIVSGIVVGSFIFGYAIAENRYLKYDINNMATLKDLVSEISKLDKKINKLDKKEEKVPEEKTEE